MITGDLNHKGGLSPDPRPQYMRALPPTPRLRYLDSLLTKGRGTAPCWYISTPGHDDASPRFRSLLQYRWDRAPKLLQAVTAAAAPLLAPAAEPDFLSPVRTGPGMPVGEADAGARESLPGNASMASAAFDGMPDNSFEAGPDFEPAEDVSFGELALAGGAKGEDLLGFPLASGTPIAKPLTSKGASLGLDAGSAKGQNQEQTWQAPETADEPEQEQGEEEEEDELVTSDAGFSKSTRKAIHSLQGHFAADPKVAFSSWTLSVGWWSG
jgi:hypothetical protein